MIEAVPAALVGERVDRFVSLALGCSRSAAAELISAGGVRLNGADVTNGSHRLAEGDEVEFEELPDDAGAVVDSDPAVVFEAVYVDDEIVVVDKPAGLVVHPGAGTPTGTLVHGLVARYPDVALVGEPDRPGVVHRLDRGTSGLLVVARTEAAREGLIAQLASRRVERRYWALAAGTVASDRGTVDAPIGRSPRARTRMAVVADGREARTNYTVQARFRLPIEVSELECRLDTGRTHQIRVHLAAIGHPVIGDERYGGARAELPTLRPALHAAVLAFRHPRSGEPLRFESPLPPDLKELRDRLS